jgi:hypothetical protein
MAPVALPAPNPKATGAILISSVDGLVELAIGRKWNFVALHALGIAGGK